MKSWWKAKRATNPSWVCIGHSHVAALQKAGGQTNLTLDAINFWETGEFRLRENGRIVAIRQDLVERVNNAELVLSMVGGSAHTVLGMVEHPRAFDFVLPSQPDLPLDETRELLAASAVRETLTELSAEYLNELLPLIIDAANGPVIQIEPPPPVADEARIIPNIPWDAFFPGQPKLIAPKWLRYKLWRMHSEVIEAACTRFHIGYMRVPEAAKDHEGFLDPSFDEEGTHANAAYGALVLQTLRLTQ